jgi:hypothetical protein
MSIWKDLTGRVRSKKRPVQAGLGRRLIFSLWLSNG